MNSIGFVAALACFILTATAQTSECPAEMESAMERVHGACFPGEEPSSPPTQEEIEKVLSCLMEKCLGEKALEPIATGCEPAGDIIQQADCVREELMAKNCLPKDEHHE